MMKKTTILTAILIATLQAGSARGIAPVGIDSLKFDRHGEFMVVDMDIDLQQVDVNSNRAQIITPMIESEQGHIVQLPSVGVYGHSRYINYLRRDRAPLSNDKEATFPQAERPTEYAYMASVPFEEWMDASRLMIRRQLYGCTNCLIDERTDTVAIYRTPKEREIEVAYIEAKDGGPVVESIDGMSYIDFVVDKTDINPDYRRNPQELMKIKSTIDTVLNDRDVRITGVWLKGFASPESPYAHNKELAMGRTEALKDYIQQLYVFAPGLIKTDYEPEDWAGLRKSVAESNIDHKSDILSLIDSDMEPDAKEALIKKRYPKEYKFMLTSFYPALRHTDYRITYEVIRFDDVDKIREVMRTKPNRLTLREFHLLANACEPGSEEFNEVFETAVRMYPDDPTANVNAAYAALKRRDYVTAEKYLARAGDLDEARYARGALAFLKEDFATAKELLQPLEYLPQAVDILNQIKEIEGQNVPATYKNHKIVLE